MSAGESRKGTAAVWPSGQMCYITKAATHRPIVYKQDMGRIVGIDLGTTNSLVAMVDSGIPLVIADPNGHRLTPSIVHLPSAGVPIVGSPASRLRAVQPAETLYSVKRFIGRRGVDVSPTERRVNYPISGESTAQVTFPVRGKAWAP